MGADCTFCAIASGSVAAELVHADTEAIAFLDHRPLFRGHSLLIPREHVETLAELDEAGIEPLFTLARRLSIAVRDAMGAEGSFVAINNRVSQSVPHLHVHIVPRVRGDGLRGFFWPRRRYADDAEMAADAERIRVELGRLER